MDFLMRRTVIQMDLNRFLLVSDDLAVLSDHVNVLRSLNPDPSQDLALVQQL